MAISSVLVAQTTQAIEDLGLFTDWELNFHDQADYTFSRPVKLMELVRAETCLFSLDVE